MFLFKNSLSVLSLTDLVSAGFTAYNKNMADQYLWFCCVRKLVLSFCFSAISLNPGSVVALVVTPAKGPTTLNSPQCEISWNQKLQTAPPCPPSAPGRFGFLPANYPVAAFTLSDALLSKEDVAKMVVAAFKAQPLDPPIAMLHVSPETKQKILEEMRRASAPGLQKSPEELAKMREELGADLVGPNANIILPSGVDYEALWSSRLQFVTTNDGQKWNWHQDMFQAGFDPKTGRPTTHIISGYSDTEQRARSTVSALKGALNRCDIEQGKPLDFLPLLGEPYGIAGDLSYSNGFSGGNLLGAPGGLCVVGRHRELNDKQNRGLAQTICSNPEDVLTPPTDFLNVGHADEIFKVIPNNRKEHPCNFSVLLASPAKAIELLNQKPSQPGFSLWSKSKEENEDLSRSLKHIYKDMCEFAENRRNQKDRPPPQKRSPVRSERFLWQALFPFAFANLRVESANQASCFTNKDVADFFNQNHDLLLVQQEIQKKIDEFESDLRSRISSRLPQCDDFGIFKVPSLFEPSGGFRDQEGEINFRSIRANHVFPALTNSVVVGRTLITPDPANETFREHMETVAKANGLAYDAVSSLGAHQYLGELHCSTNFIRYCKPNQGD